MEKFLDYIGLKRLCSHIVSELEEKVDKVDGKGLSTNDYTTKEKEKLESINSDNIVYLDTIASLEKRIAELESIINSNTFLITNSVN